MFALLPLACGAGGVIDTFDTYKEGRVQDQRVSAGAWTAPSGAAVADGLVSTPEGFEERGARLIVNWAGGGVARNRFVFVKPLELKPGAVFLLDLAAKPALPGGAVHLIVRSQSGAEWRTIAQPLDSADYTRFYFAVTEANAMRTAGSETLADVLANVAGILVQFVNPSGQGSQDILMDNFSVFPAGKEPASFK